jgi:uroporphyrinogen-III synthase
MAESLAVGETTYHLSDAKSLRLKLLKIAENVDLMSKKIAALGTNSSEEYQRSRQYLLQSQIRRAAVNFIKETLVGLPSLPTEEVLLVLQENRRKEIARKIEEERKKAQEARLKFKHLQVCNVNIYFFKTVMIHY